MHDVMLVILFSLFHLFQLEVHAPRVTYLTILKKWDFDEPPMPEDGSSFGKTRNQDVDDPNNLEERFYKWGVKPEWLQIQHVIGYQE